MGFPGSELFSLELEETLFCGIRGEGSERGGGEVGPRLFLSAMASGWLEPFFNLRPPIKSVDGLTSSMVSLVPFTEPASDTSDASRVPSACEVPLGARACFAYFVPSSLHNGQGGIMDE